MAQVNPSKKFWPTTFAGRAMLLGVAVWFINWVFSKGQTLLGSIWLKTVVDLASWGALLLLAYWLYRGVAWLMKRLLWRLRRRLVVTWLLISVLPLGLGLLLVLLLGYVLLSQTYVNLARRQLDVYLAESRAAVQALTDELKANPARQAEILREHADALSPIFPNVRFTASAEPTLPLWLGTQPEFHGLVMERHTTGRREVFAYHYVQLNARDRTALQMKYPLGGLCGNLSNTVGVPVAPGHALLALVRNAQGQMQLDEDSAAEARNFAPEDFSGINVFAPVYEWESGRLMEGEVLRLDDSFLQPEQIWQRLQQFRTGSRYGYLVFWVIGPVALIFALIAALAIVSAAVLTRTITGTVHYLYEGTRRVEAGDLQHEIQAVGNDQLGELAHSFNRMIRSIRDLLRVSAEKERLDQEMKIASQVQARLFPRHLPQTKLLDFAPGVCLPARQVSGDYYDFLCLTPELTGVVIADVCGKGVSAALLMANLQAHLRSQIQACQEVEPPLRAVGEIVARVNQLLKAVAPDASYVTLCYAEFDEHSSTLRYTNAGHNPPLIWRSNGEYERLECGGTVVGLFAETTYEQAAVQLYSGDLFVAFTDGLLEAHNPFEEEFGEARILRVLQQHGQRSAAEIKDALLAAVQQWTSGHEQEDDLTLVIFKRR
ncbi:MAG: SpoIIE family protein phosphatase [Acidobacteria bacterium]|nr:SpoIIE family protein phosphatase [Acidobacteriota bacterium]MBI3427074.1 SpoIIE family protein phosphatase [Acidobacteriota bacterium]